MKASTREALLRYRDFGIIPGSFCQAVLTNNLREAVARADQENLRDLSEIVRFVCGLPEESHGSLEAMLTWQARGGLTYAVKP